jgi:hypothetical protein
VSKPSGSPPKFIGSRVAVQSLYNVCHICGGHIQRMGEIEVAESCKKMLRLKIPREAVRHAMEDVDPKINSVLS